MPRSVSPAAVHALGQVSVGRAEDHDPGSRPLTGSARRARSIEADDVARSHVAGARETLQSASLQHIEIEALQQRLDEVDRASAGRR